MKRREVLTGTGAALTLLPVLLWADALWYMEITGTPGALWAPASMRIYVFNKIGQMLEKGAGIRITSVTDDSTYIEAETVPVKVGTPHIVKLAKKTGSVANWTLPRDQLLQVGRYRLKPMPA